MNEILNGWLAGWMDGAVRHGSFSMNLNTDLVIPPTCNFYRVEIAAEMKQETRLILILP